MVLVVRFLRCRIESPVAVKVSIQLIFTFQLFLDMPFSLIILSLCVHLLMHGLLDLFLFLFLYLGQLNLVISGVLDGLSPLTFCFLRLQTQS